MLYGIVNKINQGLLDGQPIAMNHRGAVIPRVNPLQGHSAFSAARLHQIDGLREKQIQVGWLELVLLAALLDAREIEDVFDKRGQAPRLLHEKTEILFLLDGIRDLAAFERFGQQAHRGNRRAQFMGDARNEIAFHFAQAQLLVKAAVGADKSNRCGQCGHQNQRRKPGCSFALLSVEQIRLAEGLETIAMPFVATAKTGHRKSAASIGFPAIETPTCAKRGCPNELVKTFCTTAETSSLASRRTVDPPPLTGPGSPSTSSPSHMIQNGWLSGLLARPARTRR